jgi:hypothetical protein
MMKIYFINNRIDKNPKLEKDKDKRIFNINLSFKTKAFIKKHIAVYPAGTVF